MAELHRCTKCKQELPREAFNADNRRKSGVKCWCKECSLIGMRVLRAARRFGIHREHQRVGRLGERSPCAKLNSDDVRLIRELAPHMSRREIAEKFEVGYGCVREIILRRTWSHI